MGPGWRLQAFQKGDKSIALLWRKLELRHFRMADGNPLGEGLLKIVEIILLTKGAKRRRFFKGAVTARSDGVAGGAMRLRKRLAFGEQQRLFSWVCLRA